MVKTVNIEKHFTHIGGSLSAASKMSSGRKVLENKNKEIWIAFNDIVAFAELYYNTSTKPQQLINERLKMTFTKAVKMNTEE